ncbi:hypothetical protein E4T44_01790 [Aureobasidium sp. EXF-8845]|nr:hypothetical protein E4T44_01790 [Aureobasidium sp. EXF-8845]KAI4857001.1 hypothetical protein E4T45_01519 [Aureobasidium sp. EXF-8846]
MTPTTLPAEVFRHIFSLVHLSQLASCALVSKTWSAHAIPLMYESVDLTWRRPIAMCDRGLDSLLVDPCPCEDIGFCDNITHLDAPVSGLRIPRRHSHHTTVTCVARPFDDDRSFPSLYLLTRTLLSSPWLARLILHLRLVGPVPRSVWTSPEQTCLSIHDRSCLRPVLGSGDSISPVDWLERLDAGDPISFSALVITCVPNLVQLDLGLDFENALGFYSATHLSQRLPCLHTVSIGALEHKVWMGRGPKLSSLTLAYTHLNEHGLYCLLLACPGLRSLKYDYWTRSLEGDWDDPMPENGYDGPNASSQVLVDVGVLERALRVVKDTLKVLHLHIVPPRAAWNQCLRSMSFQEFSILATLHVPLQLIANKSNKASRLHHSLPRSLRELWLNDDGALLWLHHSDLNNPYGEYWALDNFWFERQNHPVHADDEIVSLMADFLSDSHFHTPHLESLTLLFYSFFSRAWGQRDVPIMRDALESTGGANGIVIDVHELLKRSYRLQGYLSNGQYPPYFTREAIRKGLDLGKHRREPA